MVHMVHGAHEDTHMRTKACVLHDGANRRVAVSGKGGCFALRMRALSCVWRRLYGTSVLASREPRDRWIWNWTMSP